VRSVESGKKAGQVAGRPLELDFVSLRPVPASEDKGWMEKHPDVTIAAYYEKLFGRPLRYPHLPALDCMPKREAKMVFVSGLCRGMYRPGSPEGTEPFEAWLARHHNLTPASVTELEGRRGSPNSLRVVFRGAEKCVRVINLEGKRGSRTLSFHDVCRTVDEAALKQFFGKQGTVEYLELFRTEEGCGAVLMSSAAEAEALEAMGELNLLPRLTAHFKSLEGVEDVEDLRKALVACGIQQEPTHLHQFPKPRPGGRFKVQEGYAVLKATADIDMLIKAFGSTKVSVKPPTCHRTALRAQRNVNFVPAVSLLRALPARHQPVLPAGLRPAAVRPPHGRGLHGRVPGLERRRRRRRRRRRVRHHIDEERRERRGGV
jgi:hypothetical protein